MRVGSADLAVWDQGHFSLTLSYASLDYSLFLVTGVLALLGYCPLTRFWERPQVAEAHQREKS